MNNPSIPATRCRRASSRHEHNAPAIAFRTGQANPKRKILFVAEFDPVRGFLRTVQPQRARSNVMILIGSFIRKLRSHAPYHGVRTDGRSAVASQTLRR